MVNTHRLLVRGHRIPYKGLIDEKLMKEGHLNTIYRYLFYISLVIIAWLLWLIKRQRQKNRLASVRKGIES